MDKKQKKQVEKIIYAAIRWKFMLVIIAILAIAVIVVKCVTKYYIAPKINKCTFNSILTTYYELLIATSAIVTATVVLFYTIIDNRRMGIANRMIISYYAGRYTLPLCFMSTLIGLPVIRIMLHMKRNYMAEAGIVIIFLLQLGIIALILISTSFRCNIYVIGKLEQRQLRLMLKDDMEDEFLWMYMVHHMEGIVAVEGIFLEKSQLIHKLLRVPLEIGNQEEGLRWERVVYKYYYLNLVGLFRQVKENQSLEKICAILYEFVREMTGCNSDNVSQIHILINSAILNAAMDGGVVGKSGFYAYFINHCVGSQIRNEQIVLFYLFHELMYRGNRKVINREVILSLKFVGDLETEVKKVRADCLAFWEIWCEQYAISRQVNVVSFYNAMSTLEGKYGRSYTILYIKSLLHKRERIY